MKEKSEFDWDKLEDASSNEDHMDHAPTSLAKSYKDYLQGLGTQLFQSGSNAGYHLGMLPSYGYEALTGNPGYSLIKPEYEQYIPKSEAGHTGKDIGDLTSNIISSILPARLGLRGLNAASRFHPFTKGQIGRQIQQPINAAEAAGIRAPLSTREIYELNDLLGHPALEHRGAAGKALTNLGRESLIEGASEGSIPSLHSAQGNLGALERVLPELGEADLVNRRIRPMKDIILDKITQAMREGGQEESAENYTTARQGARRHYQTRKIVKKALKPLSIAALIRTAISGAKHIP